MAMGDFLGKLKGEGKSEPPKFLALVLTDQVVQAAVWQVGEDKTEIVALGTPVEWDGETGTTSELVSACDATISGAIEGLTPEPAELIVGVAYSWTDKDGILGAKRELIKAVCQELELKALGFVVLTDSIIRYLKMQEGTPTTSILIEVTRDEIVLALVRLGRTEATEVVGRGEDLLADVEEGISRFPEGDHLPSRIIVECGLENCEDLVQNLVGNDWPSKFNFLHLPKVESLPKDVAIRAVALAGGAEVARAIGFTLAEAPASKTTPAPEPEPEPEENLDLKPTVSAPQLISATDAGFKIGGSLSAEDLAAPPAPHPTPPKKPLVLPKLPHLTLPHLPRLTLPRLPLLIFLASAFFLSLGIFLLVWLLPKSMVTLSFKTKPLDESITLTLSEKATTLDTSQAIVPVEREEITVSGEKMVDTTGKKTIGDPAKGQITLYNRTTLTKTFAKGTLLTSGNLKFSLDADVEVASKSAGSDYVDVPGKATTTLTASGIGEASNLSSGTEFTIASFSKDSYVGKNDESLKGGTSKEIQTVSESDQTTLRKDLTAELLDKAKSQVESATNPALGYYILTKDSKIVKETYSAKVGAEATTLGVNLELSTAVLRYQKKDITDLVSSALTQKIPSGYTRIGDLPVVELSAGEDLGDGEIATTAKVTISLIPSVSEAELKNNLRGKSGGAIVEVLNSIPGIDHSEVIITPLWLPPRLKSMPRNVKNIQIVTTASL